MGPCVRRDDAHDGAFADSNFKQPTQAVIASVAKQSMKQQGGKSGLLRRGACHRARIRATRWLLAMTPRHTSAISPRLAREFIRTSRPQIRGRRECRALGAPAALCAKVKKHTSIVTTVTPETPGIPRAMVLTVSFGLSPVTGLVCHRSPVKVAFHRLDASVGASGPHDFAVREARALVRSAARVHRIPSRVR